MVSIQVALISSSIVLLFTAGSAFAQDELTRIRDQIQSTNTAVRACEQGVNDSPIVTRVRNEILPLETHPNFYGLMGSTAKVTQEQKALLMEALPIMTKCRQIRIEGEAGLPTQRLSIDYFSKTDAVYGRLLRGEISVGVATSERQRLAAEANSARKKMLDELVASRSNPSPSNNNSSALLPLLLQQQQMRDSNDAADARNRELIDALKNRPTQTDCTRDGWGNVSCRTR